MLPLDRMKGLEENKSWAGELALGSQQGIGSQRDAY